MMTSTTLDDSASSSVSRHREAEEMLEAIHLRSTSSVDDSNDLPAH
jgi:hypothetical protein